MLGIIAAMPEELSEIEKGMTLREKRTVGNREFHIGSLHGRDLVLVLSRIGKVAAAATATTLIHEFNISAILLTGVAGGIHPDVHIGDIVVGDSFIQHDMDASAIGRFKRFEIPLLDKIEFYGDQSLSDSAFAGAQKIAPRYAPAKVHRGLIGSGDQFIASREKLAELREALPRLLCVEMEGAAVAQVCFEFGIPFTSIRTISDKADDEAHVDFLKFIQEIAAPFAHDLVGEFIRALLWK